MKALASDLALLALALALAIPLALLGGARGGTSRAPASTSHAAGAPLRIASGSLRADTVLLALAPRTTLIGLSTYGFEQALHPQAYEGLARVDPNGDLEALLALRPDLLVVNQFVDHGRLVRIRDAGIEVLDLGPMEGFASLLDDIGVLARRLGRPDEGTQLVESLRHRMATAAADVPPDRRPRALYVGKHGTQLYGGTRGTSYHDVLRAAGLHDVAASRHEGWPEYTAEDVLTLGPELLVTAEGDAAALCRHPGFEALEACRTGHVVALDPRLLVDPGLGMVEAAEALRRAVHGAPGWSP